MKSLNYQKGVALFATLILLVVVTLASVMLIRNASFETKISGAYADKIVSDGEVTGAVEEIIHAARNGGANPFVEAEINYPKTDVVASQFPDVDNEITFVVESPGACPREENATSHNAGLVCRLLTVDSSLSYSRSGAGQNDVVTGIAHSLTN